MAYGAWQLVDDCETFFFDYHTAHGTTLSRRFINLIVDHDGSYSLKELVVNLHLKFCVSDSGNLYDQNTKQWEE
jgi:hypothetical protein